MPASRRHRRRRGFTRISAKNQITLPVQALREAGLRAGDQVRIRADGGQIVVMRAAGWIDEFAGDMTDVYEPGYLEKLRDEWR